MRVGRDSRALIRWPWKVIIERNGGARVYHLERDPGEAHAIGLADRDVPPAIREAVEKLTQKLMNVPHEDASKGRERTPEAQLSKELCDRFRARGYSE